MENLIITALFDIKRDKKGDGRTLEDYLKWFGKTLELKCDFVIYTEEKFVDFVKEKRKGMSNETYINVQKLEEIPFYSKKNIISETINSDMFKSKMKDLNRIECYLPEYNLIQYSKFGWLKKSCEDYMNYKNYIWMDAGCSRFFDGYDLNNTWPDTKKISENKITIQGNYNYSTKFNDMSPNEYIWDNNSMLVGTLFGGDKIAINNLYNGIYEIFDRYLNIGCVNNEQFLLAILHKENNELFDVKVLLNGKHLPLFKLMS